MRWCRGLHSFITPVFHNSWMLSLFCPQKVCFFLKILSSGGFLKVKLVCNFLHYARLLEKWRHRSAAEIQGSWSLRTVCKYKDDPINHVQGFLSRLEKMFIQVVTVRPVIINVFKHPSFGIYYFVCLCVRARACVRVLELVFHIRVSEFECCL